MKSLLQTCNGLPGDWLISRERIKFSLQRYDGAFWGSPQACWMENCGKLCTFQGRPPSLPAQAAARRQTRRVRHDVISAQGRVQILVAQYQKVALRRKDLQLRLYCRQLLQAPAPLSILCLIHAPDLSNCEISYYDFRCMNAHI